MGWIQQETGVTPLCKRRSENVARATESPRRLQGGSRERSKAANDSVASWEKVVRENPNNEYIAADLAPKKRLAALREEAVKSIEKQIKSAAETPATASVDMRSIFSLLSQECGEEETKVWAAICSQQLAGTVHTDVDGKYSVDVPGGYYYLYAEFESEYSEVVWFVPVKIGEPNDMAVDIHNENAVRIINKKD